MNPALAASIKPQFRVIRRRADWYADSGGSQEPTGRADQPCRRACTRSRRCGLRWLSTPACSRSISRGSVHPNAETISCLPERWRVPGPAHRRGGSRHAAHRRARRRELRRPCSQRRHIRADRERDRWYRRSRIPLQLGEPLRSWVLDPDLDKYRRMDPRAIVNAAVDTIAGGVPDEIRADYLACYDGDRFVDRCATSAGTPRNCPSSPSCCRRSPRRSRSSTAATTRSFRSPTPSSWTSDCRTAASG